MTGLLFDAVVVRSRNVPAGQGITTSIVVSEVVYQKTGFLARDAAQASQLVLAEAMADVKDLNAASQIAPVEVRVRQWA